MAAVVEPYHQQMLVNDEAELRREREMAGADLGDADDGTTRKRTCECSRGCVMRRRKQLFVVALLVGLIAWVVVDALTQTCTRVESDGDTSQRLFCDGLLNATIDGEVVMSQPFRCSASNGTDQEWVPAPGPQCEQAASCLAVGFDAMLDWIAANPAWGWLVTATAYALLTVALIPGSVLTIGSGVAFGTALGLGEGVVVGATAVLVGATAGATMAFLMGRYLLKEHIEVWARRYAVIGALDKALETQGFKVTFLLRLSPVVPFNAFNFIMGSTSCSLRNYFWATVIGIMPGTFAFVFIGAAIGSAAFDTGSGGDDGAVVFPDQCDESGGQQTVQTIIIAVGAVATVVAVVLISVYARRQFQQIKMEEEKRNAGEEEEEGA